MTLPTFEFPIESIKLNTLYENEEVLQEIDDSSPYTKVPEKIEKVYGDLKLPSPPEDRPYVYSSFVFSFDGKIGFPDNAVGPLISKKNFLDPDGALADFWLLNALRSYSDAIIMGAKTLEVEDDCTGHLFDPELTRGREDVLDKKEKYPINLAVSLDGTDIPLEHIVFDSPELTTWINTSPAGVEYLEENWDKSFAVVYGEQDDGELKEQINEYREQGDLLIICTGEGELTDAGRLLNILRLVGLEHVMVESPSYTWHLMKEKLIDEMFTNYSGIYVGGEITFGLNRPFTTKVHPHAELVKLSMHQSNFIYTRQKLHYDVQENDQ